MWEEEAGYAGGPWQVQLEYWEGEAGVWGRGEGGPGQKLGMQAGCGRGTAVGGMGRWEAGAWKEAGHTGRLSLKCWEGGSGVEG